MSRQIGNSKVTDKQIAIIVAIVALVAAILLVFSLPQKYRDKFVLDSAQSTALTDDKAKDIAQRYFVKYCNASAYKIGINKNGPVVIVNYNNPRGVTVFNVKLNRNTGDTVEVCNYNKGTREPIILNSLKVSEDVAIQLSKDYISELGGDYLNALNLEIAISDPKPNNDGVPVYKVFYHPQLDMNDGLIIDVNADTGESSIAWDSTMES